jgi:hypothetical protein
MPILVILIFLNLFRHLNCPKCPCIELSPVCELPVCLSHLSLCFDSNGCGGVPGGPSRWQAVSGLRRRAGGGPSRRASPINPSRRGSRCPSRRVRDASDLVEPFLHVGPCRRASEASEPFLPDGPSGPVQPGFVLRIALLPPSLVYRILPLVMNRENEIQC